MSADKCYFTEQPEKIKQQFFFLNILPRYSFKVAKVN
jgi:hypothetical protein